MARTRAEIGVFGGSGFYSLLDDVREVKVDTPYGPPSDSVFLADVGGRRVAFLPRHGRRHTLPPHKINYRANVWAMRSLGVKAVISPCAAGSLQLAVKPGDFVVCDQFVDRTQRPRRHLLRRPDRHPPVLGRHLRPGPARAGDRRRSATTGSRSTSGGTVVVIEGPRFSTKSESKWFSDAGWEVINMTQYPEAWLCRELGMAVVNISLITDYDAGVIEGTEAVDAMSVLEVFQQNADADPGGRARPDRALPGRSRRARGARRARRRRAATATRSPARTSACSRRRTSRWPAEGTGRGCRSASASARSGPSRRWWLESARRLDAAGLRRASGPGTTSWARAT